MFDGTFTVCHDDSFDAARHLCKLGPSQTQDNIVRPRTNSAEGCRDRHAAEAWGLNEVRILNARKVRPGSDENGHADRSRFGGVICTWYSTHSLRTVGAQSDMRSSEMDGSTWLREALD